MPLIGIVTPLFPQAGGIYHGRAIYETVRALRAYADVTTFCLEGVYPGASRVPPESFELDGVSAKNVPYVVLPYLSRPWNGDSCARALYPQLAGSKCDITLAYWLYPTGYAAAGISHALGIPVVLGARGSDLRRIPDPFTRRHSAQAVRKADYILTVSEELRGRAVDLGSSPARTRTILNGCDHTVFHRADQSAVRQFLGVAPDAELILYVGRLVAAKGIVELIAALNALAERRPRLQAVFLGDGPLEPLIQKAARRDRTAGRIRVFGPHTPDGVARWMQAASVFCLPSHSEGCPNVVIEALSCGCPVVAANVGGVPELVRPEYGSMVPPGDPARLADAIDNSLSRSWDRGAMSVAVKRTWDDVARETFEVCSSVLKPVRRARARSAGSRLRVTVVTPYFPTSANSYRGHSAFHTLRYLKDYADVRVICPLTVYPNLPGLVPKILDRPDPAYKPLGLPTEYFEYPAVPVMSRPVNGRICLHYLMPHLQQSRPDIILNYWLYPEGFAAVRAGRRLGIPVIVGSIGSDLRRIRDPITRHLVRRTVTEADAVMTVSEDLRRAAIGLGVRPGKVTTILNGCDTSVFYPAGRLEARRAVGGDPAEKVILFVGSLFETKGLGELADAFIGLTASRPDTRLVLIGEGAYGPVLERKANAAGIARQVRFLGRQPSATVAGWMRAADLFCLPSYSEGCPNVIIEALACGLPVVATDVGGIPELVTGQCGLLIPPRQAEPLRAALDSALARDWDAWRIAAVFQRGWREVAEETLALCSAVVEEAANRSPYEFRPKREDRTVPV
jgi:glycosyltransferase involved in cell wall biosynthesis